MCDHSCVYTSSSVRQSRHIVSEWWNSPTIYTCLKHVARTWYSLHYIAYLEKGRFFVTSAKLHIPLSWKFSLSVLQWTRVHTIYIRSWIAIKIKQIFKNLHLKIFKSVCSTSCPHELIKCILTISILSK